MWTQDVLDMGQAEPGYPNDRAQIEFPRLAQKKSHGPTHIWRQ